MNDRDKLSAAFEAAHNKARLAEMNIEIVRQASQKSETDAMKHLMVCLEEEYSAHRALCYWLDMHTNEIFPAPSLKETRDKSGDEAPRSEIAKDDNNTEDNGDDK